MRLTLLFRLGRHLCFQQDGCSRRSFGHGPSVCLTRPIAPARPTDRPLMGIVACDPAHPKTIEVGDPSTPPPHPASFENEGENTAPNPPKR